jgi:hypothetical protein
MLIGGISDWYATVLTPAVELIDHFVGQVEPQIAHAYNQYETGRKSYLAVDDVSDGQQFAQEVERYGNLDSMGWDMKALFEKHFPNLQRRSVLMTVYSSFESELVELCALFQVEKRLTIAVSDLSGQGIFQAQNYLEKVARLDVHRGSAEWAKVNHLRIIRNMIVHREGKLLDSTDERFKKEMKAINALKFIEASEREILLEPGFLPEAVRAFELYFKLIDNSIQKTYPR